MSIFKSIKDSTPAELTAMVEQRPNMIYTASTRIEQRIAAPDEYKALCVTALRSLSRRAQTNFPQKRCDASGWDAHRITKRIFEEQSVFDPYADKAFIDEITPLCLYYVLRYTDSDSLPKASDYTPEQFAACFTAGGVLRLRKRGCDFWPDSQERGQSDLENHRLFLEYANREGRYICGDVSCSTRIHENARGKITRGPEIGLFTDFQQEKESGTYCYTIPDYAWGTFDYTKDALLRLINSDSAVRYDRVELVD